MGMMCPQEVNRACSSQNFLKNSGPSLMQCEGDTGSIEGGCENWGFGVEKWSMPERKANVSKLCLF